jgi:hypothetical protein
MKKPKASFAINGESANEYVLVPSRFFCNKEQAKGHKNVNVQSMHK